VGAVATFTYFAISIYLGNPPKKHYHTFRNVCYGVDLLIQIIICYICWIQGSDTALNRHECFIYTDIYGQRRLRFKLRASFLAQEEM
jgi:hypothetical protein